MKFISDKYRKSRGGRSRFLSVTCATCNAFLFYYQKDGPGPLKRCYFDRIIQNATAVEGKFALCKQCHSSFGVPIIYEKENRPAIRLFVESVKKKTIPLRVI